MTWWARLRCRLGGAGRGDPRSRPDAPGGDPLLRGLRRQAAIADAQAEAIRAARRQGRSPSWEDLFSVEPPRRGEEGRR